MKSFKVTIYLKTEDNDDIDEKSIRESLESDIEYNSIGDIRLIIVEEMEMDHDYD